MRKYERDYRIDRRTPFLTSENDFRQDVDLRLHALEGVGGLVASAAAEARDRIIRAASEEISPLAAQLLAIVAAYENEANPVRDAAVSIVRGGVEARGDTLAKLLALIDAAGVDIADLLGAIALKAPLASAAFTGAPTAPTPAGGDNTTKIATTAFVQAAITALINSSPSALDTLSELATALGSDPNFATTIATALSKRLRFDAAQTLTAAEIAQARANIALSNSVTARQTVAAGPVDTAGLPRMLPATFASLSIATQYVGGSEPFICTAAQGFNEYGKIDYVWKESGNFSWTGLTPNSTLYLYVNAQTGAKGFTSLLPVYQHGGPPSSVNGQFVFNIAEMKGYMGNGSTAPETPLVFVGEVVTNSSTVTSVITYAYNGLYDSGFVATLPGVSTVVSKTHNIGVPECKVDILLKNLDVDGNYAVGDVVDGWVGDQSPGQWRPPSIVVSSRTAQFTTGASSAWILSNKTTGTMFALSAAKWALKVKAQRPW